jgi:hypothetical protein
VSFATWTGAGATAVCFRVEAFFRVGTFFATFRFVAIISSPRAKVR